MPFTIRCAVEGCDSNSDEKDDTFSFHIFPKNEDLRRKWILATNKPNKWQPNKVAVICTKHFRHQDRRKSLKRSTLVRGAIPRYYPEGEESSDINNFSENRVKAEPVNYKSKFIQVYIRASIHNVKTQAKIIGFTKRSIKCQTVLSRNVETQTDVRDHLLMSPDNICNVDNPSYEFRKRRKKWFKYL